MARPSLELLRYLCGLRGPSTSLTAVETALLVQLARGARSAVEVGAHEGATSRHLAEALHPEGRLYLVDHYPARARLERWLGFSASAWIARRHLRGHRRRVRFVRRPSLAAARELRLERPAELIFIDADHSYPAVRDDVAAWSQHLAPSGVLALHDSRLSARRHDLGPEAGPVRLVAELLGEEPPAWSLVAAADTLTALRPLDR